MKVTVELPEAELREICEITGIRKKGPAIRKLLADAMLLRRRKEIAGRFITGEWSAELAGHETAKCAEREQARTLAEQWRD